MLVSDFEMKYGDGSEFVAKTLDRHGNTAPYQRVFFNIFGVIYNSISYANGEVRLKFTLPPGRYLIQSIYGDEVHGNIVIIWE